VAKQLESISGAVTSVNAKKTGLKVQGFDDWLNISQYHPVTTVPAVGELVEVSFERTDKGAWINSLTILGAAPVGRASAPGPDRSVEIRRQVAMKCAARLTAAAIQSHEEARAEWVFPLADRVLAWLEKGTEG
jgi:hypothetical protein